jgi:hypothetical protein
VPGDMDTSIQSQLLEMLRSEIGRFED